MSDGKAKFHAIDIKFKEIEKIQQQIAGVIESDVAAIRIKIAEANVRLGNSGSGHNGNSFRPISEYKVVAALEHYNGENRTEYKSWTKKLKNVLFQARGEEWRKAFDALERHRVSTDFEELVSLDDKWDDWFEENFGSKRVDGRAPIDLNSFKLDLDFILTDKLGKSLLTVIQPHKYNGLRGYKKLFIWCVDISDSVKNTYMQRIMRPNPAKNDSSQAEAIETWDRERAELVLIDPQCELKAPFLLSAFKCLLTHTFSNYVNNHLDPSMREDYEFIRAKIYNWALRIRFEGKQDTAAPLATLGDEEEPDCAPCIPDNASGYWGGSGYGYHEPLDAMGKGKQGAKGGGGKGSVCWNCGQAGHLARNCTKPPRMGKGQGTFRPPRGGGKYGKGGKGGKGSKGKFNGGRGKGAYAMDWQEPPPLSAMGQFPGYCNGCGGWGHTWRYCKKTNPNAETFPVRNLEPQVESETQQQPMPAAQNKQLGSVDQGGPRRVAFNLGGQSESRPLSNLEAAPSLKSIFEEQQEFTTVGKVRGGRFQRVAARDWLPLMAVEKQARPLPPMGYEWKPLRLTADSGACDHVIGPKDIYPGLVRAGLIKQTPAVHEVTYGCASGKPLPNLGEIKLDAMTQEYHSINLIAQVVDVTKPLLSLRKVCEAGNKVVLEEKGGYIEDLSSGARTNIECDGSTYAVWVWVLVPVEGNESLPPKVEDVLQAVSQKPLAVKEDQDPEEYDFFPLPFLVKSSDI